MNDYYVYGIYINSIIIYVGKGKGNRKDHHLKNFLTSNTAVSKVLKDKFTNALKNNHPIDVKILKNNITENNALLYESNLIKKIGKKINDTGTLCNVTDGGNQPPNLKQIYSKDEFNSIKQKQRQTRKINYAKKINEYKPLIDKMLNEGYMLKEIAEYFGKSTVTIRHWIKELGIKMNYEGKNKKIKDHLAKHRKVNNSKPNKNAKQYTIKEPDGTITTTRLLKTYCKNKQIDYSNLRATFKRGGKHKGYSIINQLEPEDLL